MFVNREEFEKLAQIKFRLIGMVFCHTKNQYIPKNKIIKEVVVATREVNLAWYAWQEQQKKINEALREISRAINCCESIETECVLVELKGYLK